jgi:TolA-binding protein
MSVFDLHPEDLLDRETEGELSPNERAMLDAHLANCVACRLERKVRADFAADMDEDLSDSKGALLVTRALESRRPAPAPAPVLPPAAEEEEPVSEEVPLFVPRRSSRLQRLPRRAGAVVIAAAVLMLASVAVAAASGTGTRVWAAIFTPTAAFESPAEESAPSPTKPLKKRSLAVPPVPEAIVAPPTACAPIPDPPSPPPVVLAAPVGPAPVSATIAAPAAPVGRAATAMFSDANAARRRGDHATAAAGYRELLDKHGAAPEAAQARLALGRMLLDDGDAASALPLFDGYLDSSANGAGELREEAMVGRARAFEKLHRAGDERDAWKRVLSSYPQSIHTAHAEARLEELRDR